MSELSAFWHVVGGGDKGGIVVRSGEDVRSELCSERLGTGAVVKELELRGDGSSGSASQRMRFEKISGFGPSSGWVSLKLTNGKDLLRKQKGPLWRVVGGEKSGILVREGMNMNSSECGRLSTGSVVEEVELVNERLRYKLLHGTGPEFGWVSLSVHKKPLLLRLGHDLDQDPLRSLDAVERFVLALRNLNDLAIQESHDLLRGFTLEERVEAIRKITSLFEEADFRLKRKTLRCLSLLVDESKENKEVPEIARGALTVVIRGLQDADFTVRAEAALAARGVCNENGNGDAVLELLSQCRDGDASWRVRRCAASALRAGATTTALAAETDVDVSNAMEDVAREVPSEAVSLKIVALHGARSNSAIMKFQVRLLKKIIDEHSTNVVPSWFFLDAPMVFEAVAGATDPIFGEPGDFEKALSKNQPFRCWYSHGNSCYHSVDENVETLLDMIKEVAPDVIICFSQASNCISMALDALRRKGVAVPWKVTVMFSGGHIDDPIFDWQGWTSHHPTLRVFNAAKDTFFDGGEGSLQHMYPEIVEFPHSDGHMFPHSEPRASEIYNQVADEIYARCGKKWKNT